VTEAAVPIEAVNEVNTLLELIVAAVRLAPSISPLALIFPETYKGVPDIFVVTEAGVPPIEAVNKVEPKTAKLYPLPETVPTVT
jgi:hypothetical protein